MTNEWINYHLYFQILMRNVKKLNWNGKKYRFWNHWWSHPRVQGKTFFECNSLELTNKESTGEHIEYNENPTEQHEFFRMMFMMSPGIVLFFALFHLAFDWVGFIRVMIRKSFLQPLVPYLNHFWCYDRASKWNQLYEVELGIRRKSEMAFCSANGIQTTQNTMKE